MRRSKHCALLVFLLLAPAKAKESWVSRQAPVDDGLHGVFFVDEQTGWAYTYGTGTVIRTRDGGQSWQVAYRFPGFEKDFYFEALTFLDRKVGWIAGEGYVFRTADGGQSWRDISPTPSLRRDDGKKKNDSPRTLYYGMRFFADGRGLLSGMLIPQGPEAKRKPLLFFTADGGESWRQAPQPPTMFMSLAFPGGAVGYGGSREGVWSTRDGGETWRSVFTDTRELRVGQIRGLYCPDAQTIWACGSKGKLLASSDAGVNWKIINLTPNRLRSVVFVDAKRGFACGDQNKEPHALYATVDSGKSWRAVPMASPDLHRLFATASRLWAVGKNGAILSRPL